MFGSPCIFYQSPYICNRNRETNNGSLNTRLLLGRYQSGQLGRTVTPLTFVFVGSNPALPTSHYAGIAQLIEHQPSKLRVASLSLVSRSFLERWQSGRMRWSWKPLYREVPGVRIPLSPQLHNTKFFKPHQINDLMRFFFFPSTPTSPKIRKKIRTFLEPIPI